MLVQRWMLAHMRNEFTRELFRAAMVGAFTGNDVILGPNSDHQTSRNVKQARMALW